jgi:hypothetical protein
MRARTGASRWSCLSRLPQTSRCLGALARLAVRVRPVRPAERAPRARCAVRPRASARRRCPHRYRWLHRSCECGPRTRVAHVVGSPRRRERDDGEDARSQDADRGAGEPTTLRPSLLSRMRARTATARGTVWRGSRVRLLGGREQRRGRVVRCLGVRGTGVEVVLPERCQALLVIFESGRGEGHHEVLSDVRGRRHPHARGHDAAREPSWPRPARCQGMA